MPDIVFDINSVSFRCIGERECVLVVVDVVFVAVDVVVIEIYIRMIFLCIAI